MCVPSVDREGVARNQSGVDATHIDDFFLLDGWVSNELDSVCNFPNFPSTPVSAWLCYPSPSLGQSGNASTCAPNCLLPQSHTILFHSLSETSQRKKEKQDEPKKEETKKTKNETLPPAQITLIALSPYPHIRVKYTPGPRTPASPSLACAQVRVRTVTSLPMLSLHPSVLLDISASVQTTRRSQSTHLNSPHLTHIIIIIIVVVVVVAPSLATPRGLQREVLVVPQPEPTPAPADTRTRTRTHRVSRTQSIPNPDLHFHFTRLVGWLAGWTDG